MLVKCKANIIVLKVTYSHHDMAEKTAHLVLNYSLTHFTLFRQKDRNDVGGYVDGQVGKYKDGVQFVKRADLKGFKNVKHK